MDGVIQKYKEIIQSERENSRKRKSSRQIDDQDPQVKVVSKPARKTMEQSLGTSDILARDVKRPQEPHSLGAGGWVENPDRESTTSSQLSATPRRKQKGNKDSDSERGLHLHMVQKVTRSILEVIKAPNVAEKARVSLIEQIIYDLIGPTFDTMRDLEEKLRAAHLHAMLKDSCQSETLENKKTEGVSQPKLVAALEQRVQELSREKSDLETQLILCKKELGSIRETSRQTTPLNYSAERDSQSTGFPYPDRLLE